MTLPTKTFDQFVGDLISYWGAQIGVQPVLPEGDFLLAVFESFSAQLEFLQAQARLILNLTRAQTSTGADLDTWMADFDFARLPAVTATGPVQFGRFLATDTSVPIQAASLVDGEWQGGTLVQTIGGAIVYRVVPDAEQSGYDALSNSYVLAPGATSVGATVQAVTAGASSNVSAGALTQLGSQLAGIDTVSNTVAFQDGADAESDGDFRARFVLYLASLARATKSAILAAALSVQQGVQVSLAENVLPDGTPLLGAFTAFVDNGTGSPPASLLAAVYAAIDAARAFTVQPYVAGPNITVATIVLAIRVAPGHSLGGLQGAVVAAVVALTADLAAGDTLFIQAINDAAMTVPGVVSVEPGTTINGLPVDLVPGPSFEARATTGSVTVDAY